MVWKWDPATREISQIPRIWLSEQWCYHPVFLLHCITCITTSDCLSEQEIRERKWRSHNHQGDRISFSFFPICFIYLCILQRMHTFLITRWYAAVFRKIYRFVSNITPWSSNSLNFWMIEGFLHGKGFPSFLFHLHHKETIRSFHVILVYFQLCHFPA